ncbi:MAG: HD domain-containing phosphohydrolase [Halanaerobium sp.]
MHNSKDVKKDLNKLINATGTLKYKNQILLAITEEKMLEKFEAILEKKYIVKNQKNLDRKNFKDYDLIIIDETYFERHENNFKNISSFIPVLLIIDKQKKLNKEVSIPDFITEVVNIPVVSSILLNRIQLLLDFRDYSVRSENRFEYLSFHDELTGLHNRIFLDGYLKKAKKEELLPISFIAGNIDSLKVINQKYGRIYGDQLIKKTANILANLCQEEDKVVRIGGDEFLVILPGKDSKEAEKISEKIGENFYNTFVDEIKVSIGLGNATRSFLTQDIESVITTAMNNMYLNKLGKNESMKHQVIKSMINTLEAKSFETNAHAERMKELAFQLGKSINLSKREIDELKLLADLHDIGKVAIPESILKKPAKLTREEFEIIKKHPEIGYEIVRTIPELQNVAEGILSHHERWDGKGYPNQLKGAEIPILARIITVIDSFDVMRNKRAYKDAYSLSYTVEELQRGAGSQFDPKLISNFLKYVIKLPLEVRV